MRRRAPQELLGKEPRRVSLGGPQAMADLSVPEAPRVQD